MLDAPARRLLDRPGLLGVVCTLRRDGAPQANPLWFRRAGDQIHIWTDEDRRWVKNLRRAAQVAFSVHENTSPWASVTIRGTAALTDLASDETLEEIRRISARYIASDEIDAYIEDWPQTRSIVTIRPETVFAAQAFEDPVAHRRP
ncbi:MAG TPA: TIGR03618 family F420-dependent PPOX class oxidoreductase [Solirubrobacteraceae bacterium]|nr:TIGR03618 family F420-dependent PPOX class oxidoreductase [Solirubrobacteraceae bacterium]